MIKSSIALLLFISLSNFPVAGNSATGKTDNIRIDKFYSGPLGVTGQEYPIRGEVTFIGAGIFNSIHLNWQANAGEVNVTLFEELGLNPYIPLYYLSDIPFVADNPGDYQLKIWFTGLNGEESIVPASDTIEVSVQMYDYLPTRELALLESFSSINCGSCALASPVLTALIKENIEKYAMLYYHPLPYEDSPLHLFNPKDQLTRKDLYEIFYTPLSVVGSLYHGGSEVLEPDHMEMELEKYAGFTIEGTWYVKEGELHAKASTSCFADFAENNIRLLIAVVEDSVSFDTPPGSNGEKDYFFVMRSFLPDANGTFLEKQEPGSEASVQFSYTLEGSGINEDHLEVIAFVQDLESLDIHQVIRLDYQEPDPTSIADMPGSGMQVYPNPSDGRFSLSVPGDITIAGIDIFDLTGKKVLTHNSGTVSSVTSKVTIDASHLSAGMYIIHVQSEGKVFQHKINVIR